MEWFEEKFLVSFLEKLGDKNHNCTITKKQEEIFFRYCNFCTDKRYPYSYVGKFKNFSILITPIRNSKNFSKLMIWKD